MSVEVAELLDVCWLDVSGDYELKNLNAGKYAVFFVILMKNPSGFEPKVTLTLVDPDGAKQQKKVLLTQVTAKKWLTLKVGEFQVRDSDAQGDREIKFSMTSIEEMNWKKGLIVQGVLIRQIAWSLGVPFPYPNSRVIRRELLVSGKFFTFQCVCEEQCGFFF